MKAFVAGCVGLLMASGALAASLNVSTGVDNSGTPLADGALDSHWTISTDGGATFSAARVAYPIDQCCSMDTVDSSVAKWVTDPSTTANSPNTAWGIDNTVYLVRTFDLTGFDLGTVALSGVFRVADSSLGIFLNGVLVPNTVIITNNSTILPWASDNPVSTTSGFNQGINTLEMRGSSINSGWDGFYLSARITGEPSPVPEPASWLLVAVAGAVLIPAMRRRKS